jgi:hypothetical protein
LSSNHTYTTVHKNMGLALGLWVFFLKPPVSHKIYIK